MNSPLTFGVVSSLAAYSVIAWQVVHFNITDWPMHTLINTKDGFQQIFCLDV